MGRLRKDVLMVSYRFLGSNLLFGWPDGLIDSVRLIPGCGLYLRGRSYVYASHS